MILSLVILLWSLNSALGQVCTPEHHSPMLNISECVNTTNAEACSRFLITNATITVYDAQQVTFEYYDGDTLSGTVTIPISQVDIWVTATSTAEVNATRVVSTVQLRSYESSSQIGQLNVEYCMHDSGCQLESQYTCDSEASVTEAPVTSAPVTSVPVTQAPTAQAPVYLYEPTSHENYTCFRGDNETQVSFAESSLIAHNYLRGLHGVPALIWDDTLAGACQVHSDYMAGNRTFDHSIRPGDVGENIAYKSLSLNPAVMGAPCMVGNWYNEIMDPGYDFSTNSGSGTGHFTQIVWEGTERLGCAASSSLNGNEQATYLCCQYSPAGNVANQFDDNVHEPASGAREVLDDELDVNGYCDYYGRCHRFTSSCSFLADISCAYTCNNL